MHRLTHAAIVCLIVLLCLCCVPAKTARVVEPTNAFERMDDAVIALVMPNKKSNGMHIACSGVWVSPKEFLSAAHCSDLVMDDLEDALSQLGLFADTTGRDMQFVDWRSSSGVEWESVKNFRHATIVAVDHGLDLALLSVVGTPDPHTVARLADTPMKQGDPGWTVGHTVGLGWSISPASVGAVRNMQGILLPSVQKYFQISSSASYGNSGGALYDADGNLQGICSFKIEDTILSFFIHLDSLRSFLKKNLVIN